MRFRPSLSPEAAFRLALSASSPTLDLLFGRPEPCEGSVPDTSPASYPPGYRSNRR